MDAKLLCVLFALTFLIGNSYKVIVKRANCPNADLIFNQLNSAGLLIGELYEADNPNGNFSRAFISATVHTLAFDSHKNAVLYVDEKTPDTIWAIDENNKVKIFLHIERATIEKFAFDSITGNIYFADKFIGICVCSRKSGIFTILVPKSFDLNIEYTEFLIYPERGAIMWTEKSEESLAHKTASMDGTNVKTTIEFTSEEIEFVSSLKPVYVYKDETEAKKYNVYDKRVKNFTPFAVTYKFVLHCDANFLEQKYWMTKFENVDSKISMRLTVDSTVKFKLFLGTTQTLDNPCTQIHCSEICVLAATFYKPQAKCICDSEDCEKAMNAQIEENIETEVDQKADQEIVALRVEKVIEEKVHFETKIEKTSLNAVFIVTTVLLSFILIFILTLIVSPKIRIVFRNNIAGIFGEKSTDNSRNRYTYSPPISTTSHEP